MNDKLILNFKLDTFEVKRNNILDNIQTFENGILKNEKQKLHYTNIDGKTICIIDIDSRGLRIILNPNKLLQYDFINKEFLPYDLFYKDVIQFIEQQMNDVVGIDLNIRDGKIYRYDNSFDVLLSNHFNQYRGFLKKVGGVTTMNIRNANNFEIKNSLYFGNQKNQIAIYPKSKEINQNRDYYSFIKDVPDNVIRLENRVQPPSISIKNLTQKYYDNKRLQSKEFINKTFFEIDMNLMNKVYFWLKSIIDNGVFRGPQVETTLSNICLNLLNINLNDYRVMKSSINYTTFYNFRKKHSKQFYIDNEVILDLFNEMKNQFNRVA